MNKKHPNQVGQAEFDFTPSLAAGEEVTAVSEITAVPDQGTNTLTLTPALGTLSTPEVTVKIGGGTNGQTYTITCFAETNIGLEPYACLILEISDRCECQTC